MTPAARAGALIGRATCPRTHKIAIAAGIWLRALRRCAQAQDYPTQPVRFVVPYAAGGGTDAMARFFSKGLEARFGQPFIVENRPGSGTTIGANFVAKSPPDGQTILLGTSSTFAIAVGLYKKLPYNPVTDFAPIALVAAAPFVLVVHPSLPVHSVADLVKFLKANPGFNYASGGVGSQHHVNAELFRSMAGLDIKNVSYRGGGPAVPDVVAGHVKMMFADVGGVGARTDPRRQAARAGGDHVVPGRHHAGHPDHARGRHHRLRGQCLDRDRRAGQDARADRCAAQRRVQRHPVVGGGQGVFLAGSAGSRSTPSRKSSPSTSRLRSCAGAR